jgi:tetratricopeptide (TPR) repeat protein
MSPQEDSTVTHPRGRFFLLRAVIPSLCLVVFCSGCLYFNLFYNAEVAFDTSFKAHQKLLKNNPDSTITLPGEVETGYKKAIDKCLKVFELYPKKKEWHDKTLFLMGKSNYYLGEYDKAIRAFAQLQREFPASKLVPESFLYIGRSYLKKGNLEEAEKTFALAQERYSQLNKNQDISMLMAEIVIRRQGKAQAIAMLEAAYRTAKTNDKKMELAIKIAQLYRDLKMYDKAIGFLRSSPRIKDLSDQLYRIDYLLVLCLSDKGEYSRAIELVDVMLVDKLYYSRISFLLLRKAELLDKMNKTDQAIAIFKQITESANGGDAVGVAWFELGCLYQARKANLTKAKECFDKAVASVKDPDMKDTATRRSKAIETILKYGEGKMPADTSKLAALSSPEFKVGELFWLELGEPDSAYRHYCATACDTHYRAMVPKALYAAAWIARFALKDSVHADSLYRLLLARFPSNAYSQKAQESRGEKITVFTRQDSAKAAFEAAEKIFLDDEKPDSAAEAYIGVYRIFSDSEFGPKSLYAAAWIYDNVLDKNRTAKGLYEELCDSFPKCSYCVNEAKPRLKTVADSIAVMRSRRSRAGAVPAPGKPAQNASSSKVASDTGAPLLTDKDTSSQAAVPAGLPTAYSRMYRGGPPPQLPPGAQPLAPVQPGAAKPDSSAAQRSVVKGVPVPSAPAAVDTTHHAAPAVIDSIAVKKAAGTGAK